MGLICSFCGAKENNKTYIYQGATANICKDCIGQFSDLEPEVNNVPMEDILKPHEIKAELDKYVIGQDQAKKVLAVEVYNHYKRINSKSKVNIEKTNLMLVGPSGSGKTYLLQKLSEIINVPFVIASAKGLTEAGYVGKDVESMLVSLIEKCNGDIKLAEKGIIYIDEIDKIVTKSQGGGRTQDVGGEGVQQSLLTLIEGADVQIEISDPILRKKTVTINTKNILFICGGAFVGIEDVAKKRKTPNKKKILGFQVEQVSEQKVEVIQEEKINSLDLIEYGFINEFAGRVPLVVTLNKLSEQDLVSILTKVKNSITKQYQTLFKMDNVKLKFEKEALEYIAKEAIKRKVGARGLRGIMADKMNDLMYELPISEVKEFVITKEFLEKV